METFSVSQQRTLQYNKAHLSIKTTTDILWVHKITLPFIVYGAAPDFISYDITSLRLTSLVSGFEGE